MALKDDPCDPDQRVDTTADAYNYDDDGAFLIPVIDITAQGRNPFDGTQTIRMADL